MTTTLIVEDGSYTQTSGAGSKGVPGANTYVSLADFQAYAAARDYTILATDPTMLLIRAMDYLESLYFIGVKYSFLQTLQWPRTNVIIDNWWNPPQSIPFYLPQAQCEIAMAIDAGESPTQTLNQKKTRVKAGSVEIEYAIQGTSVPLNRQIKLKLEKIVVTLGGLQVIRA